MPLRRPTGLSDREGRRHWGGRAGPRGVAERPAVPRKPGNSGGGKGPWVKASVGSGESREIGDEPTNSANGSEAAGDVARQSEGVSGLSFLCAVRQGVSSRRTRVRLPALPSERR